MTKFISEDFGYLEITFTGDLITSISFCDSAEEENFPPNLLIIGELEAYFRGELQEFRSPFRQEGTSFQQRVWSALRQIPYGETRTYGEIAQQIGSPGSARAVGTACGKNQLPLLVPCHRVVGTAGIGGFSAGIERKRTLLRLESVQSEISLDI